MFPVVLASVIFFSILGVLIASQLYWFRQGRRRVHKLPRVWQRWALGVPLYAWFILLLAVFALVPFRWMNLHNAPVLLSVFMVLRSPVLMIPLSLWLAASLFAFLFIQIVRGGGWVIARLTSLRASGRPDGVSVERRYFLQNATRVAGAIPFVMVGYGFVRSRGFYVVEEVTVPIPNLPPPLDGLRLLQLTDVHASAFMPVEEIRHVAAMAHELKADLVFHTGDTLTSRGDPLPEAIAELSKIQGAHGGFGCLGNHEIYAGVTDTATRLFAERGVRLLRNQNAELEINGARVNLIGVDYQRQPRGLEPESWKPYFLRGVERLVRPDALNILLTHNPNPFLRAADLGVQLTLAGHTHGGQVQVEILDNRWSPARFITPFISGLYERNGSHLYVSRGVGTIAMPVRLNAPAEISLLTLRRACDS